MGNQKFKLFDIIPNSWVYKLKDINNTTNKPSKPQSPKHSKNHHSSPPLPPPPQPSTTKEPPQCQPRKSYYITRELTNNPNKELNFPPFSPPRRSKSSSKSRKSSRRTNSMSSCSCKSTNTFQSYPSKSNSPSSPHVFQEYDVILHVKTGQIIRDSKNIDFKLPSIITKQETKPINYSKEEKKISSSPRSCQEKGMKLKVNSPRIMGRKQGQNGNSGRRSTSSKKRRSISESFAVVKSSFDPQKDFKESMMEMIVQNNLRGAKDLEDLLACYLSLNSNQYHDVIINVFKQIWFDLSENKKQI